MAGTQLVIDSVAAITASVTKGIHSQGVFSAATFFLDVTTASGGTSTWTVALNWVSPDGNSDTIASVTGHDTENTGLVELAKIAPFDTALDAVPMPNQVVYTEASGTDALTATIYALVVQ